MNTPTNENARPLSIAEQDVRNIRAIHDDYRKALEAIRHMTPCALLDAQVAMSAKYIEALTKLASERKSDSTT
jgi:hypothetical protein